MKQDKQAIRDKRAHYASMLADLSEFEKEYDEKKSDQPTGMLLKENCIDMVNRSSFLRGSSFAELLIRKPAVYVPLKSGRERAALR